MIFNEKNIKALKKMLGNDVIDSLQKSEIYKINTKTVLSPDELKIGLQIVPRTILQWLFSNLKSKDQYASGKVQIPFEENAQVQYLKNGSDNYSGEIYKDNVKVCEFKNRSLPGLGLLILTTFELYDSMMLEEIKQQMQRPDTPWVEEKRHDLEHFINQKLLIQQLVEEVVSKKLSERDAIDRLIREKLTDHIIRVNAVKPEPEPEKEKELEDIAHDKKSKLKQFLDNLEKKKQEEVKLDKSEIKCSDCASTLYKSEDKGIKLCICYGEFHGKQIKMKKTSEGKVKFQFPKNFDIENVEMLLEDIKGKQ